VLTVLRRLLSNIAALLRVHVLLSGREARALAREIARSAVFIGVAAVISIYMIGLLLAAAVLALSLVMKPWVAALAVFGATALAMLLLFFIGAWRLRARIRRLGEGIQTLKEDLRRLWAELFRG
jgi:membrane protein DedA with SNARE-associated domain